MAEKNGKFIEFKQVPSAGTTSLHQVYNTENGSFLGVIKFYGAWRKYVFAPQPNTIFEPICLGDITNFLNNLTNAWRAEQQRKRQAKL